LKINLKMNNIFYKKIIMGTWRNYPSFQHSRKIDMEMLNEWFVAIPNHLSKFQLTICQTQWTSVGPVYRPVVPGINSGIMHTTRMVWPELMSRILFQFKYIGSEVSASTPASYPSTSQPCTQCHDQAGMFKCWYHTNTRLIHQVQHMHFQVQEESIHCKNKIQFNFMI